MYDETTKILTPARKVNNIDDYNQLMQSRGFAFNQLYLQKSKYDGLAGEISSDYGRPGGREPLLFARKGGKKVLIDGNHRIYKMHRDNAGQVRMEERPESEADNVRTSLEWRDGEAPSDETDEVVEEAIAGQTQLAPPGYLQRIKDWYNQPSTNSDDNEDTDEQEGLLQDLFFAVKLLSQ